MYYPHSSSDLHPSSSVIVVSVAGDDNGIREADGGGALPVVLRPAPGEGIQGRKALFLKGLHCLSCSLIGFTESR